MIKSPTSFFRKRRKYKLSADAGMIPCLYAGLRKVISSFEIESISEICPNVRISRMVTVSIS